MAVNHGNKFHEYFLVNIMTTTNPLTRARKKQALAFFQANQLGEAKHLYAEICRLDRRDVDAWNMQGAIHGMMGEFAEAEACCRQVINLQPGGVGAYNNLGNALKFQGKLEEAEGFYRQALKLQPNYAEGYSNLGNLLKDQGKLDEAVACFCQALRYQPNYAEAHNNLAGVLREQGKTDEAISHYTFALKLDTAYVDAYFNLGTLFFYLNKIDESLLYMQNAIQHNPKHVGALQALGGIFKLKDKPAEAEMWFRRALKVDPDSEVAHYQLAMMGLEETPTHSPVEYVKDLFDGYADKFDQHLVNGLKYQIPSLLFEAVQRLVTPQNTNLNILDFGCGTGLCGSLFRGRAQCLVGIDLSQKMLEKARALNVYDDLLEGDATAISATRGVPYDLIVAADVFVYIGDLEAVFEACKNTLKSGGAFAFSTETAEEGKGYALRSSGRYAHSPDYIRDLARKKGLTEIIMDSVIVRYEAGQPMHGNLFVFENHE